MSVYVGPTQEGRFLSRPNRFLVKLEFLGRRALAFLPNPGRMEELLGPGARLLVRKVPRVGRKTGLDVVGILHEGLRISLDTRIPNKLIREGLRRSYIPEFRGYDRIVTEFVWGDSRLDFLLSNGRVNCLLEVKSCTLVERGRALFPDAPTIRGTRHVQNLMLAREQGFRACVLFLVQRSDADVLSPNDGTDPSFGDSLRRAAERGVDILAYGSRFTDDHVILTEGVPVDLRKERDGSEKA